MVNKLMVIPNNDTQNYPFCRIQLGLNLINQPIKIQLVPKVVKPTNKKTLLLHFGDKINKQPNVPSFPELSHKSQREKNRYNIGKKLFIIQGE